MRTAKLVQVLIAIFGLAHSTVAHSPMSTDATLWRGACLSNVLTSLSTKDVRYEAGYPLEAHVLSINLPDRSVKSVAALKDALAETLGAKWEESERRDKETGDKYIVRRLEPDNKKRLPGNSDVALDKLARLVMQRAGNFHSLLNTPSDRLNDEDRFEVTKGMIKAELGVLDGIPGAIARLDKAPWVDGSKKVVTLTGGEIAGIASGIKDLAHFWHKDGYGSDLSHVTLELIAGTTLNLRVGSADGLVLAFIQLGANGTEGLQAEMQEDAKARIAARNQKWTAVPNIEFTKQVSDLFEQAVKESRPALVDWYDLIGAERFDNQMTFLRTAQNGRVFGDLQLIRREVSGFTCYRPDEWLDFELSLVPSDLRTQLQQMNSYSLKDLVEIGDKLNKTVIYLNRELNLLIGFAAGVWLTEPGVRSILTRLAQEKVDWSAALPASGIARDYGKLGAGKVEEQGDFRSYTFEVTPDRSDGFSCHFVAKWKPK